jgi:hypothetical protein
MRKAAVCDLRSGRVNRGGRAAILVRAAIARVRHHWTHLASIHGARRKDDARLRKRENRDQRESKAANEAAIHGDKLEIVSGSALAD